MPGGPAGSAGGVNSPSGRPAGPLRPDPRGGHDGPVPDLRTFEDFDRLLATARAEIARLAAESPDDGAIDSVRLQLDALHDWTRGGRCPGQGEKDKLNFGLIASRELDDYSVAPDLYALSSFVIWWGEPGRPPFQAT